MEWISFFDKRPQHGQTIFYYGERIGVWLGTYEYHHDDIVSPHLMFCEESCGVVDRMDAPWWMPYENQTKPEKPSSPYPKDYPNE
jgi:hypothetical protein